MPQSIRDVMTANPVTLPESTSIEEAARCMKERDIGDVLVTESSGRVCGVVTDRDIVVRAVAQGRTSGRIADICSHQVVAVSPNDSIEQAVRMMREKAIRRLPVLEGDRPVGIVSLGDLAIEGKDKKALADISAAQPNN